MLAWLDNNEKAWQNQRQNLRDEISTQSRYSPPPIASTTDDWGENDVDGAILIDDEDDGDDQEKHDTSIGVSETQNDGPPSNQNASAIIGGWLISKLANNLKESLDEGKNAIKDQICDETSDKIKQSITK